MTLAMRALILLGGIWLLPTSVSAAPVERCGNAGSQSEMNVCAYQAYQAADARLNRAYRTLLGRVTPAGRAKLQAAQRAWIAYRDAECAFESAGTIDGSVHPMIVGYCLEELTTEQLKRLNRQVHCGEGDLSCGGQ